jgi:tRNA pseudouridine38-40 synthase
MNTYKMILCYDGTDFSGWQIQPNGITIQQLLEERLLILLKEPTTVVGAGRTDAGVHALGQTAHFQTSSPIDCQKMVNSLNGMLPSTVRILSLQVVENTFHARYSAKNKVYFYELSLQPTPSPFRRLYCLHVGPHLDLEKLKKGALILLGEHDFTSFANDSHLGAAGRNPIRTITDLRVVNIEGGIRLEFEGRSFLYKMVRNCVGTLLEVATGKKTVEDVKKILDGKNRKLAGTAAPAHGLTLARIDY